MIKEFKKVFLMLIVAIIGWYIVMGFINKGMNEVVDKQISQSKK